MGTQSKIHKIAVGILLLLAIFLPRLSSLGTTLTIDEPLWRSRGETFIKAISTGHFEKTLLAEQPGVTTAFLSGLTHRFHSLAVQQAAVGITSGILVIVVTYFLVLLWGMPMGLAGGAVLALQPLLLGHSRVLHTDSLMTLFALVSVLSLLAALSPLRKHQLVLKRYIILSAITAALAVLTKIVGVFLLPAAVLIILANTWQYTRSWQRSIQLLGLWLACFFLSGYMLWPAMWLHSDDVINFLFERGSRHLGGTHGEEITSQWWYYLREIPFRLSTLATTLIPLGLLGFFALKQYSRVRWSLGWLLASAGILLALLTSSADKSDRYGLFIVLVLELVGVFGLFALKHLLPRDVGKKIVPIGLGIVLLWLAVDAARLHPYYLAHYNRFYPIEDTHKLGWGEGLEQAATWIQAVKPGARVTTYYPRVFEYFYEQPTTPMNHLDEDNTDFIVLYRSMLERGPRDYETDVVNNFIRNPAQQPTQIIEINGLPYVWIYGGRNIPSVDEVDLD